MITEAQKQKILAAIAANRANYPSDAKHAASLAISTSVYSAIKNGQTDKALSDANWISIARKLGVNLRGDRSAVHSNYAGMVAMLGADNRVYLGREERCHYQDMQPSYYDNQDGSLCFVCDQPDMYYFLYGEGWAHTQTEMLERGLTLRQYEEFARLQNGPQ